jgi:4-hydroxy-3-methylbut-2-en-1-yl diphosphate synthase IspG/GcpE
MSPTKIYFNEEEIFVIKVILLKFPIRIVGSNFVCCPSCCHILALGFTLL